MLNKAFLTDKEVAAVISVSESTITRICKGQFGNEGHQRILLAKPQVHGATRRWPTKALAEALGMSMDEIEASIS